LTSQLPGHIAGMLHLILLILTDYGISNIEQFPQTLLSREKKEVASLFQPNCQGSYFAFSSVKKR
jgi:hypothetical protein